MGRSEVASLLFVLEFLHFFLFLTQQMATHNYYFPAEWSHHEAVWLCWPREEEVIGKSDKLSGFGLLITS
jgi:hypothetical protein